MSGRRADAATRTASTVLRTTATAVLASLLVGAAMLPWWPVYESGAFIVAAVVAVVGGAIVAVVGALRRWPAWAVLAATAAVFLVAGVPAAVPGRAIAGVLPSVAGLVELIAGVALSWKQLVTVSVPVGSYQALLVPPFLLGLAATVAAVTIALRTTRPAAAVLPAAVVLVAGIAFGVVNDEFAVEGGLAFLVATVVWLVWVGILDRARTTVARSSEFALGEVRRIAGAAAIVAVGVAGGGAAALAIPVAGRDVIRAQLQPPFEPRDHLSPLVGFRSAFAEDVDRDPMLAVSGLPDGAGIRIATLDTYDGLVYEVGGADGGAVSGRFARLPYRLDQSNTPGTLVEVSVEVLGYDDVWVPGIGRLEQIAFGGPRAASLAEEFHYNDTTGTGAVGGGLQRGDTYVARSKAPVAPERLDDVKPGSSAMPASPTLPDELERLVEKWAPESEPAGRRLAGVVLGLQTEGYVSHGIRDDEPRSRSGHALDRLVQLASELPMVGDGEQYAVAAALMARDIGFPARVVVGYLPGTQAAADAARGEGTTTSPDDAADADGRTVLVRGDLSAWIEVQTANGAWIAVDPNPPVRDIPPEEPDQPRVVSRPLSPLPPPEEPTPVDDLGSEPEARPDDRADDGAWLDQLLAVVRIAGIVLAVLGAAVSPFAAIVIAKLRRRRVRRRAKTPVERIEGGWDEFADTAIDYGYPVRATATRAEQAATVGGLAPLVLASVVDRAVFAPGGPDDGDDDRVWSSVDDLHERIAGPRSRWERVRAAVSLRSLANPDRGWRADAARVAERARNGGRP